jgi:hypothetical protein
MCRFQGKPKLKQSDKKELKMIDRVNLWNAKKDQSIISC